MTRLSIVARLAILCAVLLGILIASSVYLTDRLSRGADTLAREVEIVSTIKIANDASKTFGDLKYWLTDLAVSLLVLSEQNAEAARKTLETKLAALETHDAATVAKVRTELDVLMRQALAAVDSYQNNERVVGNSMMAQSRVHIRNIDALLGGLVDRLEADSRRYSEQGMTAASRAVEIAYALVAAATLIGLALAFLVLRSITGPLGKLNVAMGNILRGELAIELPAETKDEFGAMTRTVATLRDTMMERNRLQAERKASQKALQKAQNRLIEAIESVPAGFALYDPDDRLVLCNSRYRELYSGLGIDVAPGVRHEDIVRAAAASGAIAEAKDRIEEWIAERVKQRHGGGVIIQQRVSGQWLQISTRTTPDGDTVSVYADITELKERERQLGEMVDEIALARDAAMKATETKSQFLANMSHELRTPLNAVIGITEMLEEDARDDGQTDMIEPLQRISRAGKHLLTLINDILDLSKIEAGKIELHIERFELRALIGDAANMVGSLAAKNNNKLEIDCPPDIGAMYADVTRVRQVVFNLLSNACKFTENGVIGVNVSAHKGDGGDRIEIAVADSGIGMTPEQMGRLFQEFSQADASTTRKYGGTGLGLAISLRICRLMGGDITVASTPGEGSVFTVELPRDAPDSVARPEAAAHTAAPAAAAPRDGANGAANRALVIDDDPTARDLMQRFLTGEGFEVACAANGAEGLERARAWRPSLITLDVLMPMMDGWSVLTALKADPELGAIPVLMVTILDEKNKGFALGAADYLTKPLERSHIATVLRKYRKGASGGTALVVEDDADARQLLRRALVSMGWHVTEAADGIAGLEALDGAGAKPDVVILDLMMPRMDGFEFLLELQRRPGVANIPVVVTTAADLSSQDMDRLRGRVESVIAKSASDKDVFLSALRDRLARTMQAKSVA